MNNVFSIKRIAALLNYEYSNSKKTHLTVFCALFACFLLFSFYNQIYDYNDAKVFAEEQKSIVSFLFILTMCIAASRHSKTKNLEYIMLPASNLEKFAVRSFICTVFILVECILAYNVSELVRLIINAILGCQNEFKCSFTLNMFPPLISDDFFAGVIHGLKGEKINPEQYMEASLNNQQYTTTLLMMFWAQSLYILCSNIWHKHRLLSGVVMNNLFSFALIYVFFAYYYKTMIDDSVEIKVEKSIRFCNIAFAMFGVLNWLLAYWFFKRNQIANRKFSLNFFKK